MFFMISFFSFFLDAKRFSGEIVFPVPVLPEVRLYYKGKSLALDVHKDREYKRISFSFDERSSVHDLNILVCEQISCYAYRNNIRHLTVASDNYKFYSLHGTRENNDLTWEISEERLENQYIPENTIIFICNPDLFEGLKSVSWKPENPMRYLPGMIMDTTKTDEDFMRAMDIACLSALDIDLCHEKPHARSLQSEGKRVVAKLSNNIHGTARR